MSEDLTRRLLDETREEISRADSKANILLAGASLAIALLGGAVLSGDLMIASTRGVVQLLAAVSATSAIAGLALFGLAVLPRVGAPQIGRARYFADHAQYASIDDLREAIAREAEDVERRHAEQLRDLSRIVRTKYRYTMGGEIAVGGAIASAIVGGVLHCLLS